MVQEAGVGVKSSATSVAPICWTLIDLSTLYPQLREQAAPRRAASISLAAPFCGPPQAELVPFAVTRRCIPHSPAFHKPLPRTSSHIPPPPFYICCPTIHRSVSNVATACLLCYVRFTFSHLVEHLLCPATPVWLVESPASVGLSTGEPGQRHYRR
jgi:hypothetical protein